MNSDFDFRDILISTYEKRVAKNPSYSLRAFARDLQVSPAHLSQVVRGKEGFSRKSAKKIAEKIYENSDEVERFCNLVESQHSRSWAGREAALKNLNELWMQKKKKLTVADFSKVMDWYHLAVLHLTDLKNFRSDTVWIADYLGITLQQAESAIQQLKELKLLLDGPTGLVRVHGAFIHSQHVPRPVLREYHRQVIEKALFSIEGQSIDHRFLTSMTFGASEENLNEMKECMKRFLADIERISYKSDKAMDKENLYCLSLQLFDLKATKSHA